MDNPVKVILGTIVGAGIGVAISRALERGSSQPDGVAAAMPVEPKETLRERWERAKLAGDAARAETEASLRSYFRQKVHDPSAMRDSGTGH
jgi:hypothetical protein